MSTVFILPSFSSGRAHGVDFDCLASVCNSTFDLRPSRVHFDVRGRSPSCAARCMNRSCSRHEYSSRAESVGHWRHHFFPSTTFGNTQTGVSRAVICVVSWCFHALTKKHNVFLLGITPVLGRPQRPLQTLVVFLVF